MTSAETKLCMAIAKAENATVVETDAAPCNWIVKRRDPLQAIYLYDYLTVPAETVRMEKALIKAGAWPTYLLDDDGIETWWWHDTTRLPAGGVFADSHEESTAEAYKAMLEEIANA